MNSPADQNANLPIPISTEEFDRKVEAGEDISDHLDWENARMIEPEIQRLEIELPTRLVTGLEQESVRLGIARDTLLERWIAQHLDVERLEQTVS